MSRTLHPVEFEFLDLTLNYLNWNIKKSTDDEDIFEHIDFILNNDKINLSFDVKDFKELYNDYTNYNCIEYLNVEGNIGWVAGKAKYIALKTASYEFLIVEREKLYCLGLNKWYENGKKEGKVLYGEYRRDFDSKYGKRKDLVIFVKMDDIKNMDGFVKSLKKK